VNCKSIVAFFTLSNTSTGQRRTFHLYKLSWKIAHLRNEVHDGPTGIFFKKKGQMSISNLFRNGAENFNCASRHLFHKLKLLELFCDSTLQSFRKLKYEETVANIWPNFGTNSKELIKVQNFLASVI
jgi:hypothetical protein